MLKSNLLDGGSTNIRLSSSAYDVLIMDCYRFGFLRNNKENISYIISKLIKELTERLSNKEHQIDGNIFRSVENINLNTIISYKDKNGKTVSFLDDYDSIYGE